MLSADDKAMREAVVRALHQALGPLLVRVSLFGSRARAKRDPTPTGI